MPPPSLPSRALEFKAHPVARSQVLPVEPRAWTHDAARASRRPNRGAWVVDEAVTWHRSQVGAQRVDTGFQSRCWAGHARWLWRKRGGVVRFVLPSACQRGGLKLGQGPGSVAEDRPAVVPSVSPRMPRSPGVFGKRRRWCVGGACIGLVATKPSLRPICPSGERRAGQRPRGGWAVV